MVTGSEKVSLEGVARWRKLTSGKTVLLNAYGVTEATITSTLYRPNPNVDQSSGADWLPIGRPIANTQTYVLDRNLESVQIGFAGELYLGGEGVARGYHGRAGLTLKDSFRIRSVLCPVHGSIARVISRVISWTATSSLSGERTNR